ncbi:MAG TPA: DUF5667 domain-containing protein [Jatrophihabitans sp.]|jgi:hypothetical protein|nr:DUF5667 domain-containing protein [Jatrophihabitans sp.]
MSAGRFAARWGRGREAEGRSTAEAELISRLRALPGPVPESRFKSDLRAQLVAITARIVSESETAEATTGSSTASPLAGRRAVRALRRPVLALVGASTVLVLLLGMAVWMSSGSLPGQSLYGVKRASENVQLSMAGNDIAKGEAYLELAGNRVREAADLLSQPSAVPAAGGASAGTPRITPRTTSLIADTLASADDDSISGMQLLGRAAVAQLSREPLSKMSSWLPRQRTLMTEVRDRIPAGPLRTRAQASVLLLQRIAARTGQLSSAMGCPCLARALADELGPIPCTGCAAVPNPTPGSTGGIGTTLPVPIPGVGSTPSGALPSVTLPTLGGGSSSSSGHAAGAPTSPYPTPALPSSQPVPLPSSAAGSSGGATSIGPIVIGPPGLSGLPVTLPPVTGAPGLTAALPSPPGLPGR